jgi:hypothetical protein
MSLAARARGEREPARVMRLALLMGAVMRGARRAEGADWAAIGFAAERLRARQATAENAFIETYGAGSWVINTCMRRAAVLLWRRDGCPAALDYNSQEAARGGAGERRRDGVRIWDRRGGVRDECHSIKFDVAKVVDSTSKGLQFQ